MFAAPSTGPANAAAAAAASLAAADRDDEVRSEMAEELSQLRSELGAAERSILVMARERDEVVEALGVAQGALAAADGRGGGGGGGGGAGGLGVAPTVYFFKS